MILTVKHTAKAKLYQILLNKFILGVSSKETESTTDWRGRSISLTQLALALPLQPFL